MHVFVEGFVSRNRSGANCVQGGLSVDGVHALATVPRCRFGNDLIDAGIGAEGERVVVPGQSEMLARLVQVGQSEMTLCDAKLQLSELSVNCSCPGIALKRRRQISCRLQADALPISGVPFC